MWTSPSHRKSVSVPCIFQHITPLRWLIEIFRMWPFSYRAGRHTPTSDLFLFFVFGVFFFGFVSYLLKRPNNMLVHPRDDLLRQLDVLSHWDRSCRPNLPCHPVTVYWHRTNQSQRWPNNARRLAVSVRDTGVTIFKSLVWPDPEKSPWQKRKSTSGNGVGWRELWKICRWTSR